MKNRFSWILALSIMLSGLVTQNGAAQQATGNAEGEAALLERAKAFVEAFHHGDAKGVAAFWTPDGSYTDQAGKHLKGREAIAKAFEELFAENKGLKLRIDIESLRFVTPDVAVEDGTTAVLPPDGGPPSRVRYTIVHVKKDGQWFLDSVRDAAFAPPSNYENLKALEWMIGDWVDDVQDGEVSRISLDWVHGQNFIMSTFSTSLKNASLSGGTQWIGWDPLAKQIRSWTFDSDGGFSEGVWTSEAGKLVIKTISILRDGKKVAASNTVTRADADTILWKSESRSMDGKTLPDVKEVRMKRAR